MLKIIARHLDTSQTLRSGSLFSGPEMSRTLGSSIALSTNPEDRYKPSNERTGILPGQKYPAMHGQLRWVNGQLVQS